MDVIDISSDDDTFPVTESTVSKNISSIKDEPMQIQQFDDTMKMNSVTVGGKRKQNGAHEEGLMKKLRLSNRVANCVSTTPIYNSKEKCSETSVSTSKHTNGRLEAQQINNGESFVKTKTIVELSDNKQSDRNKDALLVRENVSSAFKINEGASTSTQNLPPKLVVRKRVALCPAPTSEKETSTELFESLLNACKKQDSSKDMDLIISKLRKRYNALDLTYAKSQSFMQLIRQKYELISKSRHKIFLYISEIMNEMKARQVRVKNNVDFKNDENSSTNVNETMNDKLANDDAGSYDQDYEMIDPKDALKLRVLEKAMRRCERYINKLEETEVNFNDENESNYILLEKYKYRMIELYNKYCELTGEEPDAARPYLRPKHLNVTPFATLNQAITNFVNEKITRRNRLATKKNKRRFAYTDALIFPDYADILNCVKKCNDEQNLGLNNKNQNKIAKKAFTELGEHLQRCRQLDYYDTFSLYLDKEDADPALEDETLAQKLQENQEYGNKKLARVFEEFVEKENEAVSLGNVSESEKTDEQETDAEDADDDDIESDEDSNASNTDVEIRYSSKEKHKTVAEAKDKDVLSATSCSKDETMEKELASTSDDDDEIVESKSKCIDNNDVNAIKPKCSQAEVIELEDSSNESKIVATSLHCNSDIEELVSNATTVTETEHKNSRSLESVSEEKPSTVEEQLIETVQKPVQSDLPKTEEKPVAVQTPKTNPASATSKGDVTPAQASTTPQISVAVECASVSAHNTEAIEDKHGIELTKDKEQEKKPVVRIRSFAKTPCSWTDLPQQKGNVTGKESFSKCNADSPVKERDKSENKPTTDTKTGEEHRPPGIQPVKISPLGKTVQFDSEMLDTLKNKKRTVLIPTNLNRSIINVNTVTNNFTVNLNPSGLRVSSTSTPNKSNVVQPVHNIINISKPGTITAQCRDGGSVNVTYRKEQVPNQPMAVQRNVYIPIPPQFSKNNTIVHPSGKPVEKSATVNNIPVVVNTVQETSSVLRPIRPTSQVIRQMKKLPQIVHVMNKQKTVIVPIQKKDNSAQQHPVPFKASNVHNLPSARQEAVGTTIRSPLRNQTRTLPISPSLTAKQKTLYGVPVANSTRTTIRYSLPNTKRTGKSVQSPSPAGPNVRILPKDTRVPGRGLGSDCAITEIIDLS